MDGRCLPAHLDPFSRWSRRQGRGRGAVHLQRGRPGPDRRSRQAAPVAGHARLHREAGCRAGRHPLTYVVATEDPSLPPAVQEKWAARAAHRLRLPSGHSPHLSHADQVAELLAEAVARVER
ncbi:alpha/beta fold hydrolase [Streptomyces scabiei]|uniref:alpha/beta fold hydrolase n=1 Tax=Streptomyces scabiei TaxID=1930 RepID=UPI0035ABF902